jgi:DNA-binding CsgD family transcriptional regulator
MSARQLQVIEYHAGRCLTAKETGARLGISPQTVKNHMTVIYDKLGLKDQGESMLAQLVWVVAYWRGRVDSFASLSGDVLRARDV